MRRARLKCTSPATPHIGKLLRPKSYRAGFPDIDYNSLSMSEHVRRTFNSFYHDADAVIDKTQFSECPAFIVIGSRAFSIVLM